MNQNLLYGLMGTILLSAQAVFADAIIFPFTLLPFFAVPFMVTVGQFIFVVLLESFVLSKQLSLSFRQVSYGTLVANLVSTLIGGIPVFIWGSDLQNLKLLHKNPYVVLVLAVIVLFVVSCISEYYVLRLMLSSIDISRLRNAVVWANVMSYVAIILSSVLFVLSLFILPTQWLNVLGIGM